MDARYSIRCFAWSVSILVLVPILFVCSTVAADISLNELGFIAYRQGIQKLDIVVENKNSHPPTGKVTKSRQRLIQDGNRRRSDVDYEQFDMAGGVVVPKLRRESFVTLSLCLVWKQELPTDLGKNEARFNFATPEATKSDFPFFPIDGRLLGVSPAATGRLLADRPMDSTIATPNRQGPTEIIHEDDRTVTSVTVNSLNEVINPGVFTLESLSLPPGTPISGTAVPAGLIEERFHVEWDGGKLAKVKNISLEESLRLKQLKE